MERYIIVERYADNGELSHRALVDSTDGRELGTDGGEPEDQSFWRDWAWVPDELNKAQATVEALQRERDEYARMWRDGCDDRGAAHKEIEELTAALDAERAAQKALCDIIAELRTSLNAEREKVENLEHKIQSRGGLALIDDAKAKAGLYDQLETQLELLQALVRTADMGKLAAWKGIYENFYAVDDIVKRDAFSQLLTFYKATLDATTPAQTDEQRCIEACCERPHDCKWGGTGGCGYEGRKPKGGDGE